MTNFASPAFWKSYQSLPTTVQKQADKSFEILKQNPAHPSLHLKKVGRYWSARVDLGHRALAVAVPTGLVWFWIGDHAHYERLIRG